MDTKDEVIGITRSICGHNAKLNANHKPSQLD